MADTMAEFMDVLGELKSLPESIHLLCPRQHDDDHEPYDDEDLLRNDSGLSEKDKILNKEILDRIEEATNRREKFLSCMQLLAFSSEEVEQQQEWIWCKLDENLEKCDLCIKKYYYGKIWLLERLGENYDESDVARFSKMLEECDIKRITRGLSRAAETLRALPAEKRGLNTLDRAALLSIFETLSSEAMLNDETLLSQYFDEPFKLIQTRRVLKVPDYVPAVTRFLFDSNEDRCLWATTAWSRFKKPPTTEEFDFAIKRHLLEALGAASCQPMQSNAIQKLWYGLERIVTILNREQITHNLRALDIDACRLAVEHLSLPLPSLRHLLRTTALFLKKAPNDFWDAMQTISPQAVIEQVFSNPQFTAFLAVQNDKFENSSLQDMLSWITPLMLSLKAAHQPQACRFLVSQLLQEFQADRLCFPDMVKYHCFREGLEVLVYTLRCFTDHESSRGTVGRVVLSEILDVVTKNINRVLESPRFSVPTSEENIASLSLDVIRNALGLECQSLKSDYESLLYQKDSMQHGVSTCSNAIWDGVIKNLHEDNISLSRAALLGILSLVGLEKFSGKAGVTPERTQFNIMYGHVTHLACQILERLGDFKAEHLDDLFQRQDTNSALVSALFSADLNTYQAAVNLIKNVSGQSGRKEAISHLLVSFPDVTLFGLSWSFRRISNMKTFASAPRMIKTGTDVLNVLCDTQTGLLRTREGPSDNPASKRKMFSLKKLWEYQWQALTTIFEETDNWHQRGNDKNLMIEFCRDTIQFTDLLFDQYGVFVSATQEKEQLIQSPTHTMTGMVKWLRLKDEYLKSTLVKIVGKILRRLGELGVTTVSQAALSFIEAVAIDSSIKTVLTPQEKAELVSALEAYSGKAIAITPTTPKEKKQSRITTFTKASSSPPKASESEDEFADDIPDQVLMELSGSVELNKARVAAQAQAKAKAQAKALPKASIQRGAEKALPSMQKAAKVQQKKVPAVDVESFREKREREREAKKKRDQLELARLKKNIPIRGVGEQTAGQGSGLKGIGVKGKDHSVADSMMVSSGSESESDSEDELDRELFGSGPSKPDAVKAYEESRLQSFKQRGPIKKVKQVRSAKDMRARLAPDLTCLHRSLLSWDYFTAGDLPPSSDRTDYTLVSNSFRDHNEYQNTFEPLLILEAWQGFQSSKEESNGNFKSFEIKVANRLSVDSFVEVSTVLQIPDAKDMGIGEADIILLSKAKKPISDAKAPHCLARIHSIRRKKGDMEVSFRINSGVPLIPSISPGVTLYAVRITSLTPLEREYGALMALPYYDLCDEIIKAKPSPILNYTEESLKAIVANYKVNPGQAKAVKSAIDNDAFTLIQGPPGSGKTKTIVALVGALLTRVLVDKSAVPIARPGGSVSAPPAAKSPSKKLLVCAPSNAAVDELVMRLKEGVKTLDGRNEKISVIRLGRSEAINTNVVDVTLDELVNSKLSNSVRKDASDELQTLYMDHKAASTSFMEAREKMDQCKSKGQPVPQELEKEVEMLKRKKMQLSQQIDDARDKNQSASRDADLTRRKVQQEILDGAHVICATLSGSGHDMFQNLSIEFETVIIDEAAQSIELSALIPLKYGCSKCILVGDPKQLPPTVLSKEASRFQYEQSLFVRMQANHPNDVHLLDVQYRMHPEISRFPSAAFYDGRLQDGPDMAKLRTRQWHQSSLLGPYRFYDVQGMHSSAPRGHSLVNVAEIRVAMKLYDRLTQDYRNFNFDGKIGIITPYKGQLREMKQQFSSKYGNSIFSTVEFNTTDAFQGRESEVIIFSCVRASNRGIGFLADIRRMNVGLTRAKSSLWVLGNSKSLVQGEFWNGLITDARQRNVYTEGDVLQILSQQHLPLNDSFQDLEMADAPAEVPSAKEVTPAPLLDQRASKLPAGPSGGRTGLNDLAKCGRCGSAEHMTHNCDNTEAIKFAQGACRRCGDETHSKIHCKKERCRECGQFGHLASVCKSTKVLSKQERDRIAREEFHFEHMKERNRDRQIQRQLGDHDPKAPVIQISGSTPAPASANDKQPARNNNANNNHNSGPNHAAKRKRDQSPPSNARKGPNPKSRKSDQAPPPNDLAAPSKDGHSTRPINANPPANPGPGNSNQTVSAPNRPGPSQARPNNGPPRGPPPPRKKKPVDPFIRPKRK